MRRYAATDDTRGGTLSLIPFRRRVPDHSPEIEMTRIGLQPRAARCAATCQLLTLCVTYGLAIEATGLPIGLEKSF